jgi:hypothetical protein
VIEFDVQEKAVRRSFIHAPADYDAEAGLPGSILGSEFRRYLMSEAGVDIFEMWVG